MTEVEYAGPGRRLAALLIDSILVAAVITCALLAWMTIAGAARTPGRAPFIALPAVVSCSP